MIASYLGQEHGSHQAQLPRALHVVTGQAQAIVGGHLSQNSSAEKLELLGALGRAQGGLQQVDTGVLQPGGDKAV